MLQTRKKTRQIAANAIAEIEGFPEF